MRSCSGATRGADRYAVISYTSASGPGLSAAVVLPGEGSAPPTRSYGGTPPVALLGVRHAFSLFLADAVVIPFCDKDDGAAHLHLFVGRTALPSFFASTRPPCDVEGEAPFCKNGITPPSWTSAVPAPAAQVARVHASRSGCLFARPRIGPRCPSAATSLSFPRLAFLLPAGCFAFRRIYQRRCSAAETVMMELPVLSGRPALL